MTLVMEMLELLVCYMNISDLLRVAKYVLGELFIIGGAWLQQTKRRIAARSVLGKSYST